MSGKKQILSWLSVALVPVVVGCGKEEVKDVSQRIDEPRLMKTWEGPCEGSKLLDLSKKTFYKFSGAEQTEVHKFFHDANCTVPAAELRYQGALTLKEEISPSLRKIDLRFDNVSLKALSVDGRNTFEKVKFCGVASWPVDTAVVLDGKTGTAGCPLRKVPTGEFNVFSIDADTLYLGKVGLAGGATVEKDRPTSLERSAPFRASPQAL